MPIAYEIDELKGVVRVAVSGTMTARDVQEYEAAIRADQRIKPETRILFDATRVDSTSISKSTVEALLKLEQERAAGSGPAPAKTAVVFHDALGFETAKLFERQARRNVIVFFNLDVAKRWLGIE